MAKSFESPPISSRGLAVAGSLLAIGVAGLVTAGAMATRATATQPVGPSECSLPAWVSDLEPSEAGADRLARYGALCAEMAHGRLDMDRYRAEVDALWATPKIAVGSEPVRLVQWASSVEAATSQYSPSDWSAAQVIGPPNVPVPGDSPQAWVPELADGGHEVITVRYQNPQRVRAVEIYESFNPGTITSVVLLDSDNRIVGEHSRPAGVDHNHIRTVSFGCTDVAVEKVRIVMDTSKVTGWNEIDAVGLRGCL